MHPTVSSQTCKTEAVYGEGVFLVSLTKVHESAPSQQDRKTQIFMQHFLFWLFFVMFRIKSCFSPDLIGECAQPL